MVLVGAAKRAVRGCHGGGRILVDGVDGFLLQGQVGPRASGAAGQNQRAPAAGTEAGGLPALPKRCLL